MEFRILDDRGVIYSSDSEDEAREVFRTAPNDQVPSWDGDLVLVHTLAVRR